MRKYRILLGFFWLALLPAVAQHSPPFNLNTVGTSGPNSCAVIQLPQQSASTVVINVTGTSVLTLQPQVMVQGQAPNNVQVTPSTAEPPSWQTTIVTSGATSATYYAGVGPVDSFQLCVSAYTSGTAVVYLNVGSGLKADLFGGGGGGGGGGTVTTVNTGSGLTGGPITETGTIGLVTPVAAVNGGTGLNTSASTGVPSVSAGTWNVSTTLPTGLTIPSAILSGASTVVPSGATITIQGTLTCASGSTCPSSSGIPYPAGTGIAAVSAGSAWAASPYNASNPIPANFIPTLNQNTTGNAATAAALAATPTPCTSGQAFLGILANGNSNGCFNVLTNPATAAYQWLFSGSGSGFPITPLNAPASPANVYQVPCSIPGSTPTLCPPGINTTSITISTSATLAAADGNFQVTLLGSGILNIPTTTTLGLPAFGASLVNATSSAITLCAGFTDSTCNTTSTGSQIEGVGGSPAAAASIQLDPGQACTLTAVSSTLWQCKFSGPVITTVAQLGNVPGLMAGSLATVKDGASSTDCTTGGGSTPVLCQYSGSAWSAIAGSGSGALAKGIPWTNTVFGSGSTVTIPTSAFTSNAVYDATQSSALTYGSTAVGGLAQTFMLPASTSVSGLQGSVTFVLAYNIVCTGGSACHTPFNILFEPNTSGTSIPINGLSGNTITFSNANSPSATSPLIVTFTYDATNTASASGAWIANVVPSTGSFVQNNGLTQHQVVVGSLTGGTDVASITSVGTAGEPLCSNAGTADPAFCALNLAGGSSIVSGILPTGNLPATVAETNATNIFTAPHYVSATCTGSTFLSASAIAQYALVGDPNTSNEIAAVATSSPGFYGVAQNAATGAGQSVNVCVFGVSNVLMDGTTTGGDLIGVSTTTAGEAHDLAQTSRNSVSLTVGLAGPVTTGCSGTCTATVSLSEPHESGRATTGATQTIANGTAPLGTSPISSGTCASAVTVSATGVATTDNIQADFNADPTATTGYAPSATGMLTIVKYPTSGNVNFKVCNNTAASITPGAATLNWRVVR